MPMHDWAMVKAGIDHSFHASWISSLNEALNGGLLPREYYALAEQQAGKYGPDLLTLQSVDWSNSKDGAEELDDSTAAIGLLARPRTRFMATSDAEFYRRKKDSVVIRHVSGDRMVAVLEILSPGNKNSKKSFQEFLDKVCYLLEQRIHLLIVDPFPAGPRDPNGVHAAIWQEEVEDAAFELPKDKPITLVAYECDVSTRAYIEPIALGDDLPNMPLFLEPGGCVMVPLEQTYLRAFAALPRRWRDVLESTH